METILLIEDDETLARGIEYALKKENWQVQVAPTLTAGRRFVQTREFTLVLLDVMLPDGNGFDFCQEIRKTSDVPVVFLTACDEEVNIVQGLDLGGDDYVTKPFRVRELISRIKAVLRRRIPGSQQQTLTSGGITLDLTKRQVYLQNKPLPVTPMEFKLLEVFIQHALQVLGREQILDKLWDMDGEFIDDNTLSVYIRRLREKIEQNPSQPEYILTVRGFGYKWNRGRGLGENTPL